MSKITDYFTGKGLPYLDLSNCAPSVDLTSSVLNGINAQKGDKSCIVYGGYPSTPSIKLYNNAGTLVWTITPANIEATMDRFIGTGLYIPATNTLHIIAQKSTTNWDAVYCTINTLTGVITAGAKATGDITFSSAYSPHTARYSLSGSTLTVVMSPGAVVRSSLFANTTTRVLSGSPTNQIPANKVLLMACAGGSFQFLYDSTKLPFTTQGLSQVVFTMSIGSGGSGFTLFGDYFFPIDSEGVNVLGPHLGYSKASFYKAVNSMLLQINPAKTIWEI